MTKTKTMMKRRHVLPVGRVMSTRCFAFSSCLVVIVASMWLLVCLQQVSAVDGSRRSTMRNSLHMNAPYPGTYHGVNRDGTITPALRLYGSSEHHHSGYTNTNDEYEYDEYDSDAAGLVVAFEETTDGWTVSNIGGDYKYLQNENDGNGTSNSYGNGGLVDSGLQAGRDDPEGTAGGSSSSSPKVVLQRHVRPNSSTQSQTQTQGPASSTHNATSSNNLDDVPTNRSLRTRERRRERERIDRSRRDLQANKKKTWTGTVQNLVIPFKFHDHRHREVPSKQQLQTLMNGPTNSVQDVFRQSSYGQFNLVSHVTPWVVLPHTEAYYAGNNSGDKAREMIHDALMKVQANGLVDKWSDFDLDEDGMIDSIAFFHSGYAAEWGGVDMYGVDYKHRIWSHKWELGSKWKFTSAEQGGDGGAYASSPSVKVDMYHVSPALWGTSGTELGRIGVVAHETAHFLGIPDLYDIDSNDPGNGIGRYVLYCIVLCSWTFHTAIDSSEQSTYCLLYCIAGPTL
jgi:M6 family metalloprotease-like protein